MAPPAAARTRRALAAVLATAALVVPMTPAVASAAPQEAPDSTVEGELLVRFEPQTRGSERAAVRARNGLEKVRDLPIAGVELVRFDGVSRASTKAQRMQLERTVQWAEPNQRWSTAELAPPDDARFGEQWALDNTGVNGATAGADVGYLDAGVMGDTSGVVVAVLDTGTDIAHPDLADQIWINAAEAGGVADVDDDLNGYVDDVHGWDWWNGDATVFDDPVDDDHGTHVAGTIAATTGNGLHITGLSDARIMPLKFIGPEYGSTDQAVLAIDYAIEMGADIINASWGGSGYSQALADKIEQAEAAGVLFVAAAGNGGSDFVGDDNDATPMYPAGYPSDNVISVAATDSNDDLGSFSNYGATSVDLGAPGVDIVSTLPGDASGRASGTSMAAPHVSGALAHVLAAFPALSPIEASALLLERTQPLPSLAGKTATGGRLDLAMALGADLPVPTISIADATGTEPDGWMHYAVSLSGPHRDPVTVQWSTGADSDTAQADLDYVPVTDEVLTFQPGATLADAWVWAEDDDDVEDDETVTATLSSPTTATIAVGTAVGTIASDDRSIVSVTGPDAGIAETDGHARFTVTMAPTGPHVVEVAYATADGTATAGADYPATSGTLRFDGTTTAHVDVPITDDAGDEPDETFSLTLSGPVHADLGTAEASATILDDDDAPTTGDDSGGTGDTSGGTAPTGGGGGGGGTTAPAPTSDGAAATESTDPEGTVPSAGNALVATVSGPVGPISVLENAGAAVGGHARFGAGVAVEAPEAPAEDPLRLRFDLHVPVDVPAPAIVVVRNGVPITVRCTDPGTAAPDPCEASRSRTGDVLTIVVNSTRASQWDFVVPSVLRIAGDDRVSTAAAVSKATWAKGQARSVVLARADSFPDALAGGALATAKGGPLLLTSRTSLSSAVAAELDRVLPPGGTVRVLGGSSAIDPAVDAQLRELGFTVERTAGADRFTTAIAIAQETQSQPAAVLVTTGADFPDALAASAAAGHVGGVVVLTDGPRLPEATRAYLAGLGETPIYAVGGPAARALAGTVPDALTLAGADRYETSTLVAQRFFERSALVGIATGQSFPDALAAGARLGRVGAPLLLSPRARLTVAAAERAATATRVELYGGAGALSVDVERQAEGLVGSV